MKLPSKKLSIITLSAIAVIATGAISYATLNNQPKPVQKESTVQSKEQVVKPVETVEPVATVTETPVVEQPVQAPAPVVEVPKYPYATQTPNYWEVTDMGALLASAGVSVSDPRYVANAMKPLWFSEDGRFKLGKMESGRVQAKYGPQNTPEEQVRAYHAYVMERYGSWEQASNAQNAYGWN